MLVFPKNLFLDCCVVISIFSFAAPQDTFPIPGMYASNSQDLCLIHLSSGSMPVGLFSSDS